MMKVLLVAATKNEIAPFLSHFSMGNHENRRINNYEISILVTGAGILNTSFHLTEYLHATQPDLIVNVGIAGSLDKNVDLTDVVAIETDCLADFGAEDDDAFLSAKDIGLVQPEDSLFYAGELEFIFKTGIRTIDELKRLKAITVQKVHGNEQSIFQLKKDYPLASVESMEGAAVLYISNKKGINCAQIRSISNYVEKRNRGSWEINKAIQSLNDFLITTFSQ